MELDITDFFNNAGMIDYSASVAEIGSNAGADTWRAACEDSAEYPLLDTEEKREAFRVYVRGFGAWDAEKIASWNDTELNALCIQMIAGDIRESRIDTSAPDWEAYEKWAENQGGRFYRGDDGRVYYYVGE